VERTSTKHGRRTDEALARETESLTRGAPVEAHAEEFRMAEPAGEGEFEATAVLHSLDDPIMGMPADEIAARSEFAASLRPSAFPADAPTLLRIAIDDDAAEWVCETLRRVDQVTRYVNVQNLWEAAGGHREARTLPHEPAAAAPAEAPKRTVRRRATPQPATPSAAPTARPPEREREESYLDVAFDFARAGFKLAYRTVRLITVPARAAIKLRPGASG
jgi:hypothetical protein